MFSDTPAVDSGVKQAQVFVGRDTLVADAYPMKSGKQFVNTLEDNIRRRGAMDKLLSDSAKNEISNKVMDILRAYHISNWNSEPYHQNQNPAEWRYRNIKSWTNTVMNRSGATANCWLLCLIYVCYLLNHIDCTALDGKITLLALTGITPDISIILLFTFYQPVFYATYGQHFPSESEERAGYCVGFGEPYHQNQNPAEWRYRTIKSWTNTVMNRSGAPANCWLLCLIYVCYLLNHIACTALDGKIPLLALTGITPDISIILLFTFYQPVFYATYGQHFPSESEERAGYWVGFGEHCGDAMTHKILDQDTQKIIYRSAVRPKKSSTPNHRLAPHGGEVSTSSDPSEDKISSGSPLGDSEGSSPEQKAPTVFIRSRDEENPSGS